jgi:alpha-amylase
MGITGVGDSIMAIGLIGWGRFYKVDGKGNPVLDSNGNRIKITVPAPTTNPGKPWLYDFVRGNAADIGAHMDVFQWPPVSKAQGGAGEGCDGYGVYCRRDLGTAPQQGSTPTRYGTLESLMAAVAALNAHGVESYGDLVLHQLIGENGGPGVFHYLGADHKTLNGKGATTAGWFRGGTGNNDPIPPFCNEDDVPDRANDYPFGRELSYQNCNPAGVTVADAKEHTSWLTKRVGFAGYRFDDVKGTWVNAVKEIMAAGPELQFYSEYFDGNPGNLNWWAQTLMDGRSAVEDFCSHFSMQAACNGFDATQLAKSDAGYWQWNGGLSVVFVDNPDTDTSDGEQVVSNKGLAYAYMLSLPTRLALIYGKDYYPDSVWPGAYGLKPIIDNLTWISRMFAFGNAAVRWQDRDVLVITRDGNGGAVGWSGGLLTALNFNTLVARTVTVATTFGPHRWLHDYTGKHEDIWTDGNGDATFTIPSNAYSRGESFLCFAPGGVSEAVAVKARMTTQVFVGDETLDVLPVVTGVSVLPQRLRVAAKSTMTVKFVFSRVGLPKTAAVEVEVVDSNGKVLAGNSTRSGTGVEVTAKVKKVDWYSIRLTGQGLPETGVHFTVSVTYMGTEK